MPRSDQTKPQPAGSGGGVKETVEQILVAFILAFVFRCYIVEAFVIPTGSMAPTLLGAHMNFRCPDCGYHFSTNYNATTATGALSVPDVAAETYPVRCPNCGYRFPLNSPGDTDNDATMPNVQYGDRILVQKYVYLLHEPRRWDVVVFKNPDSPSAESERYQDNYIKRLTGLPGETLMILDGDLYTTMSQAPLPDLKATDFTIQTKTPQAQEALWRVVYDDDYRPHGLTRTYKTTVGMADPTAASGSRPVDVIAAQENPWHQPWVPDAPSWDTSAKTFKFNGSAGSLQFDPTSMGEKFPLTDWLAFDTTWEINQIDRKWQAPRIDGWLATGYDREHTPLNNVSDIKLSASYRRLTGSGELRMSTTKQDRKFTAVVAADEVRLEMETAGGAPQVIGRRAMHAGASKPARVELANSDYRVTLKIDGDEIAATTPEQFAPNIATLLNDFAEGRAQAKPTIRIDAANQTCELNHVSLWRDVYYLNDSRLGGGTNRIFWARPANFPAGGSDGQVVRLGKDEFFVCGDNSMLSQDARYWTMAVNLPYEDLAVQGGRVPRRFMLGRAFFVYWPAGFAPVGGMPAFVPNFGEMRFIH